MRHEPCYKQLEIKMYNIVADTTTRNSEGKTHQWTTQKTKKMSNSDNTKNSGWTQVVVKGKQFLILIRHTQCYSYIQLSPVNDWFISIPTSINSRQCFSTVMILCSIRQFVFVSRNITSNGSFSYSIWFRKIVDGRGLTFAV